MSEISTDVSHTTLTSAVSRLDIQTSKMDIRKPDTPFPQEKFSDDLLPARNVINIMWAKLAEHSDQECMNIFSQ